MRPRPSDDCRRAKTRTRVRRMVRHDQQPAINRPGEEKDFAHVSPDQEALLNRFEHDVMAAEFSSTCK